MDIDKILQKYMKSEGECPSIDLIECYSKGKIKRDTAPYKRLSEHISACEVCREIADVSKDDSWHGEVEVPTSLDKKVLKVLYTRPIGNASPDNNQPDHIINP